MKNEIDITTATKHICRGCIFSRDGDENPSPGGRNKNLCALQNPNDTFLKESDIFLTSEGIDRWRLPDGTKLLEGLTNPQIIENFLRIIMCQDKRYRATVPEIFGGPVDTDD